MKKNRKTARTGLVLLIMVLTVLALYYHMVNRVRENVDVDTTTRIQNVLLNNLETNYPATPREVMKHYNEIMQCYYNENHTEEELEKLGRHAMQLYDDELLANQTESQYLAKLKEEVQQYQESDAVISSAALASSIDVEYYTYEQREYAKIRCVYSIREKTNMKTVKELYLLRQDEEKHWKILGWEIYDDTPQQ